MVSEAVERRLMAVLAANLAGNSRLLGASEEGTPVRWKAYWRELIAPKVTEHRGRLVRITGEGLLVEFVSAIAALRCAVEIQRAIGERNATAASEHRVAFRMGINVGEIITDGSEMGGDGVSLAMRLEALAEAGGICVSDGVYEDVEGRLDLAFEDVGEQQLKSIARPVRVYRVRLDMSPAPHPTRLEQETLSAFEESLANMRKLAASDPGNAVWQRDVSVSLNRIGDIRRAAGDRVGALAAYEESLAIRRKLAAPDPGNAGWQRDLSVSLNRVGDTRLAASDRAAALSAYEENLAIVRKLAASNPSNAGSQAGVVMGLAKLSDVTEPPRARAALHEALVIAEALAREDRLTAAQKNWPQLLRDMLAKLPPEQADAR